MDETARQQRSHMENQNSPRTFATFKPEPHRYTVVVVEGQRGILP